MVGGDGDDVGIAGASGSRFAASRRRASIFGIGSRL
jgi:hypothetical protein